MRVYALKCVLNCSCRSLSKSRRGARKRGSRNEESCVRSHWHSWTKTWRSFCCMLPWDTYHCVVLLLPRLQSWTESLVLSQPKDCFSSWGKSQEEEQGQGCYECAGSCPCHSMVLSRSDTSLHWKRKNKIKNMKTVTSHKKEELLKSTSRHFHGTPFFSLFFFLSSLV